MEKLIKSWSQFKALLDAGLLFIEDQRGTHDYILYGQDSILLYKCVLANEDMASDITDYETNYQSKKSTFLNPIDPDGRHFTRAESRPLGTITCFTDKGDSATNIGDGNELYWDFSNDDDLVNMPSGSTMKRKRIEFSFLDSVWMKEGALYFHKAKKESYLDFYVVCPENGYYLDNDGELQQATEDTPIIHYGIHIHIQGDCPMGDELNTESCSVEIKSNYKFWLDITVPNTDDESTGYVTLELYRKRTVIL